MALTKVPSNLDATVATTQSASDNSTNVATTAYVTTAISNLVDSSPSALNTLNELAAALNDDASFSTTVNNSIATKLPLAGGTLTGALTGTSATFTGGLSLTSASGSGGQYLSLDNTHTGGRHYALISTNDSHGSLGGGDFAILDFDVSGNDAARTRLLIDSSGTVAVGTTDTHSWHSVFDGRIRIGARGVLATTTGSTQLIHNSYYDGAYKYIGADFATRYYSNNGEHVWLTAGSGSADGTISFSSPRMLIDNNGNVGINHTTPEHHLHVTEPGTTNEDGIVKIGGSAASLGLELRYNQASNTEADIIANPTYTNVNALMRLAVDGDANPNQIVLKGDGNVGIGLASPGKRLHIFDATQANQSVKFGNPAAAPYGEINYNSTGLEHLYIDSHGTTTGYGNIVFRTGPTPDTRMFIKDDGNVGINESSPQNTFHVKGATRLTQSTTHSHALNAGTILEVRGNSIGSGVVDEDYFKGFKIALNDQTEWGSQAQFSVGRWVDSGNNSMSSLVISLGHGQINSSSNADVNVLKMHSDRTIIGKGIPQQWNAVQSSTGAGVSTTGDELSSLAGVKINEFTVTTKGSAKVIIWYDSGQIGFSAYGAQNPQIAIYQNSGSSGGRGSRINRDHNHDWYPISSGPSRLFVTGQVQTATLAAGTYTFSMYGGIYNGAGSVTAYYNYQATARGSIMLYTVVGV